ncbi:MAG TPA: hypothetical protein VF384_03930 [Planctomycetota bacterium]
MQLPPRLLALSLFAATLCGQTEVPVAAPHAVLETVGPDGWRVRFGPTNLGSLLESEKGRALWQRGVMPLLAFWQQMLGDDAAFAASKARVLGYGGRIRAAFWFEEDRFRRDELTHVAFVLEGDGRTDLGEMAKDLRLLQTRLAGGEWAETDVGGAKLELCTKGDGVMTAPLTESGCLLVSISTGQRFANALPAARAFAAKASGKPPPPNSPALRLQVDLPAIVALSAKGAGANDAAAMRQWGLSSLGNCELTLGTAGPHVQMELAQEFLADAERGAFAALLPATAGIPALRHCVPAGPGSWKVGHFDFLALYLSIEKALATINQTAKDMRAEIRKELGVDIVDDLLAHLTDDVLLILSPSAQIDRPEDVTWTLAVRVRDEAAFGKGLTTMMAKGKPYLTREATQKIGEVEVHRYGTMFGYDVMMCVGNGVFAIAGGRDAEQQVTAMLNAAKSMPAAPDAAAAAKNPAFDDLQRHLPPGCNGLAIGDIGSVIALPARLWFGLLDEFTGLPGFDPDAEDDPEQREAALALLREHRLATLRSATGFTERTWRWRLFW